MEGNSGAEKLMGLCQSAWLKPEFQPSGGITHCNTAADFVAAGMGCMDLRNGDGNAMVADKIYAAIKENENWRPVTIGGTWILASDGALVFGIATSQMLKEEHGHIATVIPGDPVFSGHWNCMAPLAMNVGKENFIGKPMSFSFQKMPEFYVWIPSL